MNFWYKIVQFMSGRYGNDKLNIFLMITAVIISVLNLIIRSVVLLLIVNIIIVYAILRMLSRNIEARRREYRWFNDKLNYFKNQKELYEKQKNDKSHVYRKCPACKAVLRLPHRLGKHTTVCPRCNREFKVNVRK